MGGKGKRRREKNYRAAHGAHTRLPPPPDPSKVDALPSKLREIMSFASTGSANLSRTSQEKRKREEADSEKKFASEDGIHSEAMMFEDESDNEHLTTSQGRDNGDAHDIKEEKRKKKRKRKQVDDLRFEAVLEKTGQRRRDHKKRYLEAKKKKKQKKSETEEELGFLGCEQIKFGEVVQGPPKLTVPKKLKNVQGASHERLRLQAIEAYRNRRGWTARPGLKLPSPVTTTL